MVAVTSEQCERTEGRLRGELEEVRRDLGRGAERFEALAVQIAEIRQILGQLQMGWQRVYVGNGVPSMVSRIEALEGAEARRTQAAERRETRWGVWVRTWGSVGSALLSAGVAVWVATR